MCSDAFCCVISFQRHLFLFILMVELTCVIREYKEVVIVIVIVTRTSLLRRVHFVFAMSKNKKQKIEEVPSGQTSDLDNLKKRCDEINGVPKEEVEVEKIVDVPNAIDPAIVAAMVEQSKKVMVENQEMKEQMKWMHEKVKKMEKEGLKPGVSSPSQSLQQAGPSGENQERGEVKNALKEYLETMHEGLARSTDVPPLRKQLEEIKNEKGKRFYIDWNNGCDGLAELLLLKVYRVSIDDLKE